MGECFRTRKDQQTNEETNNTSWPIRSCVGGQRVAEGKSRDRVRERGRRQKKRLLLPYHTGSLRRDSHLHVLVTCRGVEVSAQRLAY